MDAKKVLAGAALAGVLALGVAGVKAQMKAPEWKGAEKCAGVAAKGMNDCAAGSHQCAGHSTEDRAAGEWIWVPEGVCGKIAGGTVAAG
jgi:uncharacterized membrane protein